LEFPQRAEGGFFEEPASASERHCGRVVHRDEVTRDEPDQLVDFENWVMHVHVEEPSLGEIPPISIIALLRCGWKLRSVL